MLIAARAASLTCLKSWYFAGSGACRPCSTQSTEGLLRVCVVGSGPAGLYSTDRLLKAYGQRVKVDLLDRLPTPFGLVRSGVAPDHQHTKVLQLWTMTSAANSAKHLGVVLQNVLNQFTEVLQDSRCHFFGNVTVGRDVGLPLLHSLYHAVIDHSISVPVCSVMSHSYCISLTAGTQTGLAAHALLAYSASQVILAYGAEGNKQLNIPGQKLAKVFSAREFVWWYNAHPDYTDLKLDLSKTKSVAICGLGNVAVDCARVLLQPAERLASTDIAQHALTQLQSSAVSDVHLIGRRGPVQAAFTPKELREILEMPGVQVHINKAALKTTAFDEAEMQATRMKRRVYDILTKAANRAPQSGTQRNLHLHFLRSPAQVHDSGSGEVDGLEVEVNKLQNTEDGTQQRAIGLGQYERIPAQIVLESIGYMSLPMVGAPFDTSRGTIPNRLGKVLKTKDGSEVQPGLYVCGWVKRGPSGIIGTNLWDAQQTVDSILEDFPPAHVPLPLMQEDDLSVVLRKGGVPFIDLQGYTKIDKHEIDQGQKVGKPREKLVSTEEMLQIAASC